MGPIVRATLSLTDWVPRKDTPQLPMALGHHGAGLHWEKRLRRKPGGFYYSIAK